MTIWSLRGRCPEDEAFLLQLYAGTRAEELHLLPWSAEQKEAFVHSQYQAREQSYRSYYPTAVDQVILVDGKPAGRLLVLRAEGTIGLLDIAMLPEYHGQGIGSALVEQLLEEGQRLGMRVWLHVAVDNERAIRLYRRLGFRECDRAGMHITMEALPASTVCRPMTTDPDPSHQ